MITASNGGVSKTVQIRLTGRSGGGTPGGGGGGGGGGTPGGGGGGGGSDEVVPVPVVLPAGPSASFALPASLQPFVLIAGSAVTCTTSTVTGDVGVSPGTAITGFPGSGCVLVGNQRTTAESAAAKADLTTFYNGLEATPCTSISGNLNGVTLAPGTYCVAAASTNLTDTLTFTGNGLHLLRFASTFITSPGSRMLLRDGATCAGVAYQVGSSATFDGSVIGNVTALTAITFDPTSSLSGRALTRNAAVTLSSSNVTNVGCN